MKNLILILLLTQCFSKSFGQSKALSRDPDGADMTKHSRER